jgi:ribosome-binding factor A
MSLRLERVRELLKRELGEIIRREISIDEAGLINVNDVIVTNDLQNATVYVGILGNASQHKRGLEILAEKRKFIQGLLGRGVVLKYTPQLRFVLDESIERGNRVLKIMEELEPPASPS